MHCPRCGQQQASVEIKFCSRCGFPLGLVSELLAHGGFLPQLADLPGKKKKWLTRKNGLKFSLTWFIFFTMLLTALAGVGGEEDLAGVFAIIGSLGGLLLMTSSFLFLSKELKPFQSENFPHQPHQFAHGMHQQNALPPQSYQPAEGYIPAGSWKAPNTGDLTSPGSVTDATTKLLKKDE